VDLRHLLTFRTIIEKGSFSLAADALEISQPAVSAQVRSLEERLGHRLLDRSGRRVRTTEAGDVLNRFAEQVLALEDQLTRDLQEIGETVAGPLVIGSSTGPGELVLPHVVGRFAAEYPGVRVSLQVMDTHSVCELVLEGELEVGFVGAVGRQRGLAFEPLIRDELVVIVPPDHELAGRTSIELEELARIPMLMQQKGSGVRSVLEDAMRTAGLRRRDLAIRMELGLQQSVKAAVLDGIGITVVSRLAVQRELEEGSLVALELRGPGIARDFQVVTREGRTLGRASAAFLEFARAELATG
jgi:DNA-binding transcriptional LysR family regulator